jgi:hypothetical protein
MMNLEVKNAVVRSLIESTEDNDLIGPDLEGAHVKSRIRKPDIKDLPVVLALA